MMTLRNYIRTVLAYLLKDEPSPQGQTFAICLLSVSALTYGVLIIYYLVTTWNSSPLFWPTLSALHLLLK